MVSPIAHAAESFIVDNIQVKGLQRTPIGTVYNYLPIKVGEEFNSEQSGKAIRALFDTGFFKDVLIEKQGNTLVVRVQEYPSIAKVIFEGNDDLKTEELNKALQTVGLSEGKVFNPQTLDKVEQELKRQYFSQGKYSVKIDTKVSNLTRNRVGIHIDISEGQAAKIKQINIVGHQSFEADELLKNFELSTTNLLSFYTKDDQYAKQKLSADLERLTSFYLDRGYLKFRIESSQISMTPNKKEMYVTVNIKEGNVFTLSKVKLAGNLIVNPEELIKLMQVGPGEIFSRKNATATSKNISDRLGDEGYIFSNVNMIPDINEELKTVEMTFFVDPGKRVYVRKVNISGNNKTRDEVLRREMRQMESSWASTKKIERSKARLSRLGYFESVDVETPPVVGAADQIDVNYSVVEKASGNLSAGVGFSQTSGFIINANVSQDNIFGSGKRINLAFNNSDVSTQYQFGYYDPYFTLDGVSMGYDIGYRARDAENANISRYSTDVFNSSLNFGLPLNENDRLRFNIDFRHTKLKTSTNSSTEILDFVKENGNKYLTLSLSIGWTHDTLNRAIFPTSGGQQRFSALATIPGSDLEYYKINYKQQHFFALSKDFTLRLNAELAYGDGYGGTKGLPFFEHFFAGGTRSIRGFDDNTLGPRDSRDDPFGGSGKIVGNAELLFPVPFFTDLHSVRLGAFFDAGTVSKGFKVGDMRYSVGLSGEWLSPFGALSISIAKPLNSSDNDEEKMFQFSFGSGF
ncbi:MAG: outer membrane protein assembly factor BamA [Methylococcales bacterium]|nr:outer membrane protein assembly factor BamA [Methylococcales bacterium]